MFMYNPVQAGQRYIYVHIDKSVWIYICLWMFMFLYMSCVYIFKFVYKFMYISTYRVAPELTACRAKSMRVRRAMHTFWGTTDACDI